MTNMPEDRGTTVDAQNAPEVHEAGRPDTAWMEAYTGPSSHALRRAIVLDDLKILYLPVPKAACTSILWLLADLAGLPEETFDSTVVVRVASSLTIHNLDKWPAEHLLSGRDPAELRRMLASDDWLCFTVVRDPAKRLWSAWQSKVLLHEPKVARRLGDEPWWPSTPASPDDIVAGFRRFTRTLVEPEPPPDAHWWPQARFLDLLPSDLHHVGKVEELDATLELFAAHVAPHGRQLTPLRRENLSPLPFSWALFDEEALEATRTFYADDYERFGYPAPEGGPESLDEWCRVVSIQLSAVQSIIERDERLGVTHVRMSAEAERLREEKAKAGKARRTTQKRLEKTRSELANTQRRLDTVLSSTSWRLTRPIRVAAELVARARGGQAGREDT